MKPFMVETEFEYNLIALRYVDPNVTKGYQIMLMQSVEEKRCLTKSMAKKES